MTKLVTNTKTYLDCMRLFNAILDITPEFLWAYKYSVGNRMHELAIDLLDEKKRYKLRALTLKRIWDGDY